MIFLGYSMLNSQAVHPIESNPSPKAIQFGRHTRVLRAYSLILFFVMKIESLSCEACQMVMFAFYVAAWIIFVYFRLRLMTMYTGAFTLIGMVHIIGLELDGKRGKEDHHHHHLTSILVHFISHRDLLCFPISSIGLQYHSGNQE